MPNIGTTSRLAFIATMDITNFLKNSERLNNFVGRLGQSFVRFGQTLSRSLSLVTGILEGFAVKVASSFDELSAQLEAISGGEGFNALIEDARKLGRSTRFTATEVLTLTRELKKLGLSTEETAQAVRSTIGVTTVFGGDLVQVGDALAALTRQFTDLELSRAADVLAVAFRKTALSTDNFREAFKNAGLIANLTGLSFERSVAALGVLANTSQKAGIAGTRFKTVLAKLAENGIDASEGLLAVQAGGNSFTSLLELFKVRGVIAASAIQQLGLEMEELTILLEDVDGAAEGFGSTMKDRLFFSVARAKAALEDIGISLGNTLAPFIARVSDGLEALADKFANMDAKAAASQAGFALLLIALGPVVFALGQLAIAATALLSPLGALIIVLAGFTALSVRAATQNLLLEGSIKKSTSAFGDFQTALADVGGDIANFSTAQLEVQLTRLRSLLKEGSDDMTQEVSDILDIQRGQNTGITGLVNRLLDLSGRTVFEGSLIEQENGLSAMLGGALGISLEDLERTENQLERAEERQTSILDKIIKLQEELEKREKERARIAKERLAIQVQLGLLTEDDLKGSEDLFENLIGKLKGAVSVFGAESRQITQVFDDLNALDLAKLEDLVLGKFPDLLAGDLDTASLQQQADVLDALADIFGDAVAGFTELRFVGGAETFADLETGARELAKAIGQQLLAKELKGASDQAINLSNALTELGLATTSDALTDKISALRQELKGLLEIDEPTDATKTRIDEVAASIVEAEADLERTQLAAKLKELREELKFGEREIQNPFDGLKTAPEITEEIAALQTNIVQLKDGLAEAAEKGVAPLDQALTRIKITERTKELDKLFRDEAIAKFNDSLTELEGKLSAIDALSDLGVIDGFQAAKDTVENLTEQVALAQVALSKGLIDKDKLDNLVLRLREAKIELNEFFVAFLLIRGISNFANLVADAFTRAKEESRKFGEVLKESLTKALNELIVKLAVLTTLFLILSALSGGTGKIAAVASNALGGQDLGSFLATGLTSGGPGFRSLATGATGGVGTTAPAVRVEGLLAGDNIVIANQRGTRAIDRTFG